MKKETYKQYISLITYTILLGFLLMNIKVIGGYIWRIISILSPLWFGIGFAFVLNVPMSIIEKNLFEKSNKKTRTFSLTLSILLLVQLLIILFVWVLPDFIKSATYLVSQIPGLIASFNELLLKIFDGTDLSSYLANFTGESQITEILSTIFTGIINNFSAFLSNLTSFLVNMITAIIIAIYLLFEKEKILKGLKNFIDKMFEDGVKKRIEKVYNLANKSFHNFITYQCLECLILGLIMFIAFTIFRFPYALTIAFLTAITAIIPMIGATVACIIGMILIGTTSIKQAIIFFIVFQVIQQIENNLIYPKVVGKHIGLPPIITIVALLIGGQLAGLVGMVICVPITSIIYSLFKTMFDREKIPKIKVMNLK